MNDIFIKIIAAICIALLGTMFIGATAVLLFGEQDYDYNTGKLACGEIRECILVDVGCVETTVKNSFLGVTWDVEHKSRSDQKEYYKNNCLNRDVLELRR